MQTRFGAALIGRKERVIIQDMNLQKNLAILLLAGGVLSAAAVKVQLKDGKGMPVGTATISQGKRGDVLIHLKLRGLPVGDHAAHIHVNAKCDGPDFASAGGHFNPDMKKHGLDNPDGPHAGDMANFSVIGKKGKADTLLVNSHVTMGTDSHSIFSNGGTALVIHGGKDDLKTDPAGNAGPRIACGIISK